MIVNFHHAHLFASDINASLEFYQEMFGGIIVADIEMAGARNVFLQIGKGRLHFYDQPPRDEVRGAIHHLGMETDDLEALVAHMKSRGVQFRKDIADFGFWKYVMAPAPDNVLLELFQPVRENYPASVTDNVF
ncbi:MAG: VOC family protein [Syntrophales bacterium]|jgi:catechol 2,3-dioxygenase-like lactoylglutathione lyase family enzyme|nr:VOC family protein [Syntrophales bacterium]MCK9527432.1 VOC family protein [Syntrophales bacterium]MDX9921535.1 VOC family protein [Syntrophales bacterium]